MPKSNETTKRDVKDYFEYSEKERAQNPDLDGIGRRLVDIYQAGWNAATADATLKGQISDTGERYDLEEDKIGEFLKKEYQDRESREYLVDGAILTCTNCTKREISIDAGGKELPYYAKIDASIDADLIKNLDSDKVAGRLIVTDNSALKANELTHATVADSIGRDKYDDSKQYNIPNFGNCQRKPDSNMELEIFEKIHNEAGEGEVKRKEGSCRYLMKLEEEWENFDLIQSYCTFHDDRKGEREGITMTSMLFCKHGGIIYPVTSGQTMVEPAELILIYQAEAGALVSGNANESGQAAQKGEPVKYDKSTYLSKWKYKDKSTPQYYIVNYEDAYIDENGLLRISKMPGYRSGNDYYCVAMAKGFTKLAEEYCTPAEEGNINYGYKLQVRFEDEDGKSYSMDVIVAEAKGSSDSDEFYPHDHLVEFVVDEKPKGSIVNEKSNVSFDLLLGGKGLEIKEVYAYKDGAFVEGNYRADYQWKDK
ncbi:MAG: hypothetical protein HFI44_16180 [Lachnospiraceae bacterium]|nr:hypothetical protein [Lachnospiraceae bacterium]GFI02890.1 hypothetical protein IMSAGC005_01721 [Lachnospiraceae bacterium]